MRLDLFFTARQTVAFAAVGPNAVSVSGLLERAVAQEEDLFSQISNDMISARLGFGGAAQEGEEDNSRDETALLERLLSGFGDESGEGVVVEEEAPMMAEDEVQPTATKKRKKKKSKQEQADREDNALSTTAAPSDASQRLSESAKRKCVNKLTSSWGGPLLEGPVSGTCTMWTVHAPNSEKNAVKEGKALRLAEVSLASASREKKEPSIVHSKHGLVVRLGLGMLPAVLEMALKGLRRGTRRVVWLARSGLTTKEVIQVAQLLEVDASTLRADKDGDMFLQIRAE